VHHGLWLTGHESSGEATEQMGNYILSGLNLTDGAHIAYRVGCFRYGSFVWE